MGKRKRIAESSSSSDGIMHLPEDVLVEILCRIPILTLREKLILVCKTWASIILRNPIMLKRHALHGEPGLFLQDRSDKSITQFLELKEGIKFKQRDYKIEFPGEILGSSGGLALFYNYKYEEACETLHVANPFTGYVIQLPSPPKRTYGSLSNIGVIPCSGNARTIKVVIGGWGSNEKLYWWVLTVGVDISWRRIPTTLIDYPLFYEKLISVGGVMYTESCFRNNILYQDRCIHAIDLRDETSHFFQFPKELGDGEDYSWLMEMGEYLCCIVKDLTVHNVWILKQNTWVKLYTIDFHYIGNSWHHRQVPIGWLDNNQSLVFTVGQSNRTIPSVIVAYNVKTQKKITYSGVDPSLCNVKLHKNTLFKIKDSIEDIEDSSG